MSMFKCEHLTKKLGEYTLNDISFEIEPGMVLGVIGINGSGKTTLLRSLLGSYRLDIEPEDGGEIFLDGKHFRKDIKEWLKSLQLYRGFFLLLRKTLIWLNWLLLEQANPRQSPV